MLEKVLIELTGEALLNRQRWRRDRHLTEGSNGSNRPGY